MSEQKKRGELCLVGDRRKKKKESYEKKEAAGKDISEVGRFSAMSRLLNMTINLSLCL